MIVQPFSFLQGPAGGGCAPIQGTNFDPVPDAGDGSKFAPCIGAHPPPAGPCKKLKGCTIIMNSLKR
jgi:hypothetical protein